MELYTRTPVAAGAFYPLGYEELTSSVSKLFAKKPYKKRAGFMQGMICPHAGYMYSGKTAAKAYYELSKHESRTFIIIGPNHTGMGDPISVMYNAKYRTPLGSTKTDQELGRRVCDAMGINNDFLAHSQEHCIEVQLPFLQFLYNDFKILPIVIGDVDLNNLKKLGSVIAKEDATIIASSDLTHHGDVYGYNVFHDVKLDLRDFDMKAIELIQKLDVNEFHKLGAKSTICGYKPITVLMQAMKERRAKPKFLDYSTSADVTGDYKNVVSYASLVFE